MTLRWRQGPSYWSCHLLFLRVHSSRKLGREYGRATWTALGDLPAVPQAASALLFPQPHCFIWPARGCALTLLLGSVCVLHTVGSAWTMPGFRGGS